VPCLAILRSPPFRPKPPLWSPVDVSSCPVIRPKPPLVAFGRAQLSVPCLAILRSPPFRPKPPLWSPVDVPSCLRVWPKPRPAAFGRAQLSVPCPRHFQVPAVSAEASSLVARWCALVPQGLAEASPRCLWTRLDLACLALATLRSPPFRPKPPLWSPVGVPSCLRVWPKPRPVAFGRAWT
jgi:hypothetical protein